MVSLWRQLSRGVRTLFNGGAADRRVDDEVQHFLDEAAADYEAAGLSSADAQRAARLRPRHAIVRMVMGEGTAMAAAGIAIGAMIAAAATRSLTALLFGVSRFDWVSYTAVAVTLIVVSALACWLPARRASRVDPALTLRAE